MNDEQAARPRLRTSNPMALEGRTRGESEAEIQNRAAYAEYQRIDASAARRPFVIGW